MFWQIEYGPGDTYVTHSVRRKTVAIIGTAHQVRTTDGSYITQTPTLLVIRALPHPPRPPDNTAQTTNPCLLNKLQYGGKGERSNSTTSTEPNNTVNQISGKYLLNTVSHWVFGYVILYNTNDNRLISTFKSSSHQLCVYTYVTYTLAFDNVPVHNIIFIVLHMYWKFRTL